MKKIITIVALMFAVSTVYAATETKKACVKNEKTGKFEKITVGQLYDIFITKNEYIRDASDPDERIDASFFEEWFYRKHIADKHFRDKITNQTFQRI
jgi:hypothetical protein